MLPRVVILVDGEPKSLDHDDVPSKGTVGTELPLFFHLMER